jgi:aryl sulfotransferase
VTREAVRYRSDDEDSARWNDFRFRDGDIVISTRSKSGTTWMQMICALLVMRTAELPLPLADISPWLDWLGAPLDEVTAALDAQDHRRFIKTHTPLDGVPLDERATFIVVCRQPLDIAVSLYHQGDNLDPGRMRLLKIGRGPQQALPRQPITEWLRSWIEWEGAPDERLDSLPGVMWHFSDAWSRRHLSNVLLIHFSDLVDDLAGQMVWLAAALGMSINDEELAELAEAATFQSMRTNSKLLAPNQGGVLKSTDAFFRRGTSGAGADLLSAADLAAYRQRAGELAPADLVEWLHR